MSITYEEALATLEAMFGEPWTRATLDLVLRHEKGHMENTCERILNHGSQDPQILIDRLQTGDDNPQVSIDEELARQLNQQQTQGRSQASAVRKGKARRGKPTDLPDDFLRVPGYKYASNSRSGRRQAAGVAAADMDDETLARMLQDELFSEELARNPDFAHLARGRRASTSRTGGRGGRGGRGAAAARSSFPGTRRAVTAGANPASGPEERPKILNKISEMGDNARKRLAMFATQFEQRLNGTASSNDNNNTSFLNRGTNLNYNAPVSERKGLLDDDFEDTIEFETRKNQ